MATRPQLWLGLGGPMTDSGIRQIITERAKQAGIGHLHPHQLRHTFAHRWPPSASQRWAKVCRS